MHSLGIEPIALLLVQRSSVWATGMTWYPWLKKSFGDASKHLCVLIYSLKEWVIDIIYIFGWSTAIIHMHWCKRTVTHITN